MRAGQQPDLFSRPSRSFQGDAFGESRGAEVDQVQSGLHLPERVTGKSGLHFDGPGFDPALDGDRLTRQLDAVRVWMLGHGWQSLVEIAEGTGYGTAAIASISAQLRHLRKARFGGYTVERRRRTAGTWEYKVNPPARETAT